MWFASHVMALLTELLRRNRASVNWAKIFRAPCRKNYTLDRKMDDTFLMGTTSSMQHAEFGEDRTTRAGCRCENVVFFCHAPSAEHRAFEGCIVRIRIALPFIGRFRRGLQIFFRKGLHFQTRYIVLTIVAMAPQFSRNCGQKLRKVQKSAEKFVRTTSYR